MADSDSNKHNDASAARADAGGSPPAPPQSRAMPVTRPAPVTGPKEFRLLCCGVDTLDIGVYVEWSQTWLFKYLEHEKEKAQTQNAPVLFMHPDLLPILVHPRGKGQTYRFHVQTEDLHVYLSPGEPDDRFPRVYVSISARLLWQVGVSECIARVRDFLEQLFAEVHHVQVSRLDLAADYLFDGPLQQDFLRDLRVCKSRKSQFIENDNELETCYFGAKKSPIQARIYNKAVEVLHFNTKLWMAEIWQVNPIANVWRVEFQIRREKLRDFGIDSIEDLLDSIGGLWQYLTNDWLSLRLDDDSNTTRRTVHPWWANVQSCAADFGTVIDLERRIDDRAPLPVERCIQMIAGYLLTAAARLNIPDLWEATTEVMDRVEELWQDRDWPNEYAKRAIECGRRPPTDREEEDCDVPF